MARRKSAVKKKKEEETLVDIIEVKDQAQGFMEKNQNKIFGALTLAVLVIGGIFLWNNFVKGPKNQTAMESMQQAQVQFERDSFALALQNPGGGFDGFLDIIDNYGGTPSGNMAKYYAGVCYLNLGQYEAARDWLNKFSAYGEVTPIMKYGALGDAHSELGDLSAAMSNYKSAVSAGNNELLTAYYLKKVGLLHQKNGDNSAALAAFQQIKDKYPNSPDGQDVEKYITRLNAVAN